MLKAIANMAQELRDQQLGNVYMMEDIDEQVDKIVELKQHIEYIRKDIINTRKRQLTFMAQLFDLYKTKDMEIERLHLSAQMAFSERQMLEQRRDHAFNALLELFVERRRMLSMVQENTSVMGMQYQRSAEMSNHRMEAHDLAEESMKIWSIKIDVKGLANSGDAGSRKETEYKLGQMIRELEIKQKQLLKMIQSRDQTEAKRKLLSKKYEVQGKLGESLELLILLIREAKEDGDEMKLKIRETLVEIENIDRKVRMQEAAIQKHRSQLTEMESRLKKVNQQYDKVRPEGSSKDKEQEKILDEEILQAKRRMKQREQAIEERARLLEEQEDLEELKLMLSQEMKRLNIKKEGCSLVKASVYKFRSLKGEAIVGQLCKD